MNRRLARENEVENCSSLCPAVPPAKLFAEKLLDDRNHALDLRVGQFGINRQA